MQDSWHSKDFAGVSFCGRILLVRKDVTVFQVLVLKNGCSCMCLMIPAQRAGGHFSSSCL